MDIKDTLKPIFQKQFERILEEFDKVYEYVKKNFSDVEFTVEFNDDSGHPVNPSFKIKSRLFTGEEMSLGDRMLRKMELTIVPELWEDTIFMDKFISNIYDKYTKSITKEVNDWYQKRKTLTQSV